MEATGLPIRRGGALKVLGTMVANRNEPDAVSTALRPRLAKLKEGFEKVKQVKNFNFLLNLLNSCTGFPRVVNLLRTTPSAQLDSFLTEFDTYIDECWGSMSIGLELSATARARVHLPGSLSGIGITHTRTVADAAYVAAKIESVFRH